MQLLVILLSLSAETICILGFLGIVSDEREESINCHFEPANYCTNRISLGLFPVQPTLIPGTFQLLLI